jgi:hypothetical protein
MVNKESLEIGDTVKVRTGFIDPEYGLEMSGWHGRVTQIFPDEGTALIAFDSLTLQNLPETYIEDCEEEGLSWNEYGYDLTDLIKTAPRDTLAQSKKTLREINESIVHNFLYLGEEGREIRRLLLTVDPDGELDALDAWFEYLNQTLKFPFEAVVDEQMRGPLRSGDKVRVHSLEDADEMYGIIVKLRRGREQFHLPLCQLAAADNGSPLYDLIDLYRTWFANH